MDQAQVSPFALQPLHRRPPAVRAPLSTTQNTRLAEAYGSVVMT